MKIKELLKTIDDLTIEEVLEYIEDNASNNIKKTFVVTLNSEILMAARSNPEYEKILTDADLALVDSMGVYLSAKMLGIGVKERIPGVDLVDSICHTVAKKPITVSFLGGRSGVAKRTAECLKQKYPDLRIGFAIEEWPKSASENLNLKTDILFVAFGSPKQELWISRHLPTIEVNLAMGVGGAFDFISRRVRRAPKLLQKTGLEWLFRLTQEPWRLKRQLKVYHFALLVIKEKIFN